MFNNKYKQKNDIWAYILKAMLFLAILCLVGGCIVAIVGYSHIYFWMCEVLGICLLYGVVVGTLIIGQQRKFLSMSTIQLIGITMVLAISLINCLYNVVDNVILKKIILGMQVLLFLAEGIVFYKYLYKNK